MHRGETRDIMSEFFIGNTDSLLNLDPGNINIDMVVSAVKAGGRAFLDESGKNVSVAWRTIDGSFICLPRDLIYLKAQLGPSSELECLDLGKSLSNYYPSRQFEPHLMQVLGLRQGSRDLELTNGDITYRFASEGDFARVDEIRSDTFILDGPNYDLYRLMFGSGGHVGGIFDAGNCLVGFTAIIAMWNDQTQRSGFLLDMVGVDPTLQSRGIGRFAVRALALVAQSYGINNIELTYDLTDPKLAHFYHSLGFRVGHYYSNLYGNNSDRFAASLDFSDPTQRQILAGVRGNEHLQQEGIQLIPITEVAHSEVVEKINNRRISILGVQGSNYLYREN